MKDRKSNEKTFVLHFLLHHGWPGLQEKHEELKVFPLLRSSQQLQEEGVSFLLILHIFCLNLSGSVKRKANQFETRKQKGPAVRILNGKYPQVIEHRAQISWMMCSGESYHRLRSNPATSAMSRMIVMINGRIRHWEVGFRWSIILTTSARLYPTQAQQKQESSFQWFQMTCALNCDGKTWQPNDRSWVCGRGIPAKNRTRMHCKTHTCLI